MLTRMKNKKYASDYTFAECCLVVTMFIGVVFSLVGGICAGVTALAIDSYWPLMWLLVCAPVAVLSLAGLMYVEVSKD